MGTNDPGTLLLGVVGGATSVLLALTEQFAGVLAAAGGVRGCLAAAARAG